MKGSIASLKLVEFGARSLLVLLCVYLMPADEAARFGTVMLFVGLFGFLVGFERYIDLQRRLHSMPEADSGAAIASFARLVAVGYLLLVPLLYALLVHLCGLTQREALLAVAVAVVEHASQECYRVVLVTHRHRRLLLGSAAKTVAVLLAIVAGGIVLRQPLSLDAVLSWWAGIGGAWMVLSLADLRTILRDGRAGEPIGLRTQWSRSGGHFAIGLVALLAVQADRLVAIQLLATHDLAQYFRAVMTAGAAYQVLTFGSFNRIALDAYRGLQRGEHHAVRRAFRRERMAYLAVLVLVPLGTEAVRRTCGIPWLEAALPPLSAVALACGSSLLRGVADFESIALNHAHLESRVLVANAVGACVTVIASISMGGAFGLRGLLAGSVAGSFVAAVLLWCSARSLARTAVQARAEDLRA
jgi:hypothetical protein